MPVPLFGGRARRWDGPITHTHAFIDHDVAKTNKLFERPNNKLEKPDIIFATDAYALGLHAGDVDTVVQLLLPPTGNNTKSTTAYRMRNTLCN